RGPDRPGGNSLAEGQVFGYRTGKAAAAYAAKMDQTFMALEQGQKELQKLQKWIENGAKGTKNVSESIRELRRNMYRNCLVIRNEKRLTEALDFLNQTEQDLQQGKYALDLTNIREALDLRNMIISAKSIVLAALL